MPESEITWFSHEARTEMWLGDVEGRTFTVRPPRRWAAETHSRSPTTELSVKRSKPVSISIDLFARSILSSVGMETGRGAQRAYTSLRSA